MVRICRAALIACAAFLLAIVVLITATRLYEGELHSIEFTYSTLPFVLDDYDSVLEGSVPEAELQELTDRVASTVNFQLELFSSLGLKDSTHRDLHERLSTVFERKTTVEPSGEPGTYTVATEYLQEDFNRAFRDSAPQVRALTGAFEDRLREKYGFRDRLVLTLNWLFAALFASLVAALVSFERLQFRQRKTPVERTGVR